MRQLIFSCAILAQTALALGWPGQELPTIEQYLRQNVAKREDVAKSIVKFHRWRFDGELGGIDGEYVFKEWPERSSLMKPGGQKTAHTRIGTLHRGSLYRPTLSSLRPLGDDDV